MQLGSVLASITVLIATATSAFSQSSKVCPAFGAGVGGRTNSTESVQSYMAPQPAFKSIEGAPYSGRMSFQTVRTLANGTHLSQSARESPMMYRDSMGRTRTDVAMTPQPIGMNKSLSISRLAEINDPVAGYHYIIDDLHKIVHRIGTCTPAPQANFASGGAMPANAVRPSTEDLDLGVVTMSGVAVGGRRWTTTFPPGTYQGNDGPVTTMQEIWHSALYGLDFLTKRSDLNGEQTSTMTNFTAGEPDPALFHPPPGYQIVDETAPFTITIPYQGQ